MFRKSNEAEKNAKPLSFKRPFTSNFIDNSKVIRTSKVTMPRILKINTIIEKTSFNQTYATTKYSRPIQIPGNLTPESSSSAVKSVLQSTNAIWKPLQSSNAKEESEKISGPPYKNTDFLKHFKSVLSKHEAVEILDHPVIYYWGQKSDNTRHCANFYGFDDNKGNYIAQQDDQVAYRYQIIKLLGKGTFGQVFECFDYKENQKCALKIIKNQKRFNCQAHTEIKILKLLLEFDSENTNCVLHIKDYFIFRNHICITSELLGSNLFQATRSPSVSLFSLLKVKQIAQQILRSLKYLKKLNIVHCDLKPENILFVSDDACTVKLIDYGSSCMINERVHSYIQSRSYRAPEIILGLPYDYSIDMWSFGCIVVELLIGRPYFQADSEAELLKKIIQVKGVVPQELLNNATKRLKFYGEDNELHNKEELLEASNVELRNIVKDDCYFLDFIEKCLEWDPAKRMTPEEALVHPWLRKKILRLNEPCYVAVRGSKKRNLIINCL